MKIDLDGMRPLVVRRTMVSTTMKVVQWSGSHCVGDDVARHWA
ncbi:MAG: hypothetical protein AAGF11_50070 [Myxococcota bacterium]